jgi:NDP-sugar pyrophosphorylase family protein
MKAIVLAGGKGSRLQPWMAPKCLMPVNGVTILQRLLKHLLGTVSRVIVCLGYRGSDVRAAVHEHGWSDRAVMFSDAGEDAAMGRRLLTARPLLSNDQALICYGDELADVDLAALKNEHDVACNAMTVTVHATPIPGGSVLLRNGRYVIVEDETAVLNIGYVIVEPDCWRDLAPSDGLSDWINRVPGVGIYCHKGKRATINSLADLKGAEEMWK